MTEEEIDWHIKAFQDDLASVGKRAKTALRRAKADTMNIVSERNSN